MDNMYLAHVSTDGERRQSLQAHLLGTGKLAETFAGKFDAGALGAIAGLLHDIGKYAPDFQKRVRGANCRADHTTAGTQAAWEICPPLAFAIAGHHGGLPDGGTVYDTAEAPTLSGRLKREAAPCNRWRQEVELPALQRVGMPRGNYAVAFWTRMLYSCLVDADYLDTERFMTGNTAQEHYDTLSILLARLMQFITQWEKPASEVNNRRNFVLRNCIMCGNTGPRGLYTLTVPTGGGKTVSSLAFALCHAVAHGLDRILYVIPYTSIIEQTVHVFSEILGEDNVRAHYAAVEGLADTANPYFARVADNWDAPVVVTTAVQFFESLYANRPAQCRKLHNLANAVIVLDEAQTLPMGYLRPCVAAVAELVRHYRSTAVLCTATQPALDELFHEYAPELRIQEICQDTQSLYAFFRRTNLQDIGVLSADALTAILNGHMQVLCVVNRRSTAISLFRRLRGEGNFCMSTFLCPADRRKKLDEIRGRLAAGLTCRVVSTSLVEAGVDLDFPTAYREETGLDSLLQTAGRCNREGRRRAKESTVHVFRLEAMPVPRALAQNISAAREIFRAFSDPGAPEAIRQYFSCYLSLKGADGLDIKRILPAFQYGISGNVFPFRTVAERFHLIESPTRTVWIPIGEGATLLARLRTGERSRALYRRLGQYGVGLYPAQYKELCEAGIVELLPDGSAVLQNMGRYDPAVGLVLDAAENQEWTL